MAENPQIDISDIRMIICLVHGEPFRVDWPKGYIQMALPMLKEFLADPIKWGYTGPCEPKQIQAALKTKALCCRACSISRDLMIRFYVESGIGMLKVCDGCKIEALGTPYKLVDNISGKDIMFNHLCFRCVLNNIHGSN